MRQQFISSSKVSSDYDYAKNLKAACDIATWAVTIISIEGGYLAFESYDEAQAYLKLLLDDEKKL